MKLKSNLIVTSLLLLTLLLFSCGNQGGSENIGLDTNRSIMMDGDNFTFQLPLPIRYASGHHIVIPPEIPQPPQILNYEGNCSGIYVEWQEEPNAERYFVKYRDENGYETTLDPELEDPNFTYGEIMDFTIPDLVGGEIYDVCVMAWNTEDMSGCNDGSPTDEYGWQFGIEALGLGIPSGLALSSDGETINMVWSRVDCAEEGYEIEIEHNGVFDYDTEAQSGNDTITHSYEAIAGETYNIRVRSLRGSDVSDWGPAENITPEIPEIGLNSDFFSFECTVNQTEPVYPQTLRITNEGGGTLQWESQVFDPASSWLGLTPTSGYLPSGNFVDASINVVCGEVGLHSGTIRIEDFVSGNYQNITVNLTVHPEPIADPIIVTERFHPVNSGTGDDGNILRLNQGTYFNIDTEDAVLYAQAGQFYIHYQERQSYMKFDLVDVNNEDVVSAKLTLQRAGILSWCDFTIGFYVLYDDYSPLDENDWFSEGELVHSQYFYLPPGGYAPSEEIVIESQALTDAIREHGTSIMIKVMDGEGTIAFMSGENESYGGAMRPTLEIQYEVQPFDIELPPDPQTVTQTFNVVSSGASDDGHLTETTTAAGQESYGVDTEDEALYVYSMDYVHHIERQTYLKFDLGSINHQNVVDAKLKLNRLGFLSSADLTVGFFVLYNDFTPLNPADWFDEGVLVGERYFYNDLTYPPSEEIVIETPELIDAIQQYGTSFMLKIIDGGTGSVGFASGENDIYGGAWRPKLEIEYVVE